MLSVTLVNNEIGYTPKIHPSVIFNGTIDCVHQVTIEQDVFTGYDVRLYTGSHDYTKFGPQRRLVSGGGEIYIEEGVWLASNCIIIGPCRIGKFAVVGAGAVVTHNVPERVLVAGNPAIVIKKIGE